MKLVFFSGLSFVLHFANFVGSYAKVFLQIVRLYWQPMVLYDQ